MKLLISSITRHPREILEAHLKTILWQDLPDNIEVEYFYLVDPDAPPETEEVLEEYGIPYDIAGPKPEGALYAVNETTHQWQIPTFHWLAREKQNLFEVARQQADKLILVDSDLMLEATAVKSLLSCMKPVVSGVFWTNWMPDTQPLPQTWLQHPYGMSGKGLEQHEYLQQLEEGQLLNVDGLGAFTLFDTSIMDKVGYWPLVSGLPQEGMWQGEDRHFCVKCNRMHIKLWADGWPLIFHVYRPSDVQHIPQALARLQPREPAKPKLGDHISAIIEPLEEPNLPPTFRKHLRGRLGTIKLLPELEQAFTELKPGDQKVMPVYFPHYWPVPEYRGQPRVMRVQLIDTRPDGS